jgi:hypothetical protein
MGLMSTFDASQGMELTPGNRNERAIQIAVSATRSQVRNAAPVGPQGASAQFFGRRLRRVGKGWRFGIAQTRQAKPGAEQVCMMVYVKFRH